MKQILPPARPKATADEILAIVRDHGLDADAEKVLMVGIRGYYKNTLGKPFENDRNLYDDAMFVIARGGIVSFNCNVDPSKYRKGIASLATGIYKATKWRHKGKYPALQIVRDRVNRDDQTGTDEGRHGINFHYGGDADTWSEGCQTFPRAQYWQFQGLIYELMDTYKLKEVTYLLTEN